MAQVLIRGGSTADIPTADEIGAVVRAQMREAYRGIKYGRMPLLTGTPSGSALSMGGHTGQALVGPEMGTVWVIRHLWIKGLTTGTTPDITNLVVNNQTWWQFNGNNFAYTFGAGELVLQQGEAWGIQSVGTFAATGTITFGGAYWSVPGEMTARLVAG